MSVRRLVDAQELADVLRVSRAFVYEHADELGAIPLGTGPKPRLRFDPEAALERLSGCSPGRRSVAAEAVSIGASGGQRSLALGTNVELLPIRGSRRG